MVNKMDVFSLDSAAVLALSGGPERRGLSERGRRRRESEEGHVQTPCSSGVSLTWTSKEWAQSSAAAAALAWWALHVATGDG